MQPYFTAELPACEQEARCTARALPLTVTCFQEVQVRKVEGYNLRGEAVSE